MPALNDPCHPLTTKPHCYTPSTLYSKSPQPLIARPKAPPQIPRSHSRPETKVSSSQHSFPHDQSLPGLRAFLQSPPAPCHLPPQVPSCPSTPKPHSKRPQPQRPPCRPWPVPGGVFTLKSSHTTSPGMQCVWLPAARPGGGGGR